MAEAVSYENLCNINNCMIANVQVGLLPQTELKPNNVFIMCNSKPAEGDVVKGESSTYSTVYFVKGRSSIVRLLKAVIQLYRCFIPAASKSPVREGGYVRM